MQDPRPIKIAVVGSCGSGKSAFCRQAEIIAEKSDSSFFGQSEDASKPKKWFEWIEVEDPELLVRQHPDVVVQVVDCTDLDESLVLTPQLIDMHLKLVLALDRYDDLLATDHSIDYERFGRLMGVQAFPVNTLDGKGVEKVLEGVVAAYEEREHSSRHVHVNYGSDIEHALESLLDEVGRIPNISDTYSKRYLAIRLLERPEVTLAMLHDAPNYMALAYAAEGNRRKIEKTLHRSPATLIHEARHDFIRGALNETLHHSDHTHLEKVDALLTNRWLGLPILIAVLYLVFQCTFTLGAYPQEWIQAGVDWLSDLLHNVMPDKWYTSLLADGIVQGIGAVLSFLPNIIILFFFISVMEDTGYMARVAFLMDKLMHKVGLHGRSFVPMLVGFGCNVPAIMAARSIENKKDRTLTMLMIPFMSCGARLPVYLLFVGAFFPRHRALVMMSLYLIGVLLSIVFALIMKRTKYFRQGDEDYVNELPAFHKPMWRNTWKHIWERCEDYLKKISTVILWASIIIWALYYFPRNEELTQPYQAQIEQLRQVEANGYVATEEVLRVGEMVDSLAFEMDVVQKEHSALAAIGRWMEPVMRPLGFDWRMNVCILTGLPAKEAIVSTMGILYHQNSDSGLEESLRSNPFFTSVKAYAFLMFVLLYFPCVATIATLRREAGRGWALFAVVNSLVLAWLMAFIVFQVGSLLF
ncbi:MAG: ferrous iron transport protein B [Bacteroidales bacterium]|nr:ferrous iron transport protein B [Bacteroidales bacterium]